MAEGACGAVGSYMAINSGKLNFKFQRKGADKLTACTVYPVADIEAIKGNGLILSCMSDRRFRWIPEVMGQEGDKSYNLKVDVKTRRHTGLTK